MKIFYKILKYLIFFVFLIISCNKNSELRSYKTENVIIIVVDGPRYTETWGDSLHRYIPRMANYLSKEGVVYTDFYTNGPTYTVPGHTAITTGLYQNIDNGGNELPDYPSIFQYWNKKKNLTNSDYTWIIASKDKLEVLADCKHGDWNQTYTPSTNCGIDGLGIGSGYRHDSLTFAKTLEILTDHRPKLVLINFREPDYSAHQNDWEAYLKGIEITDEYVYRIWEYIQNDIYYKDKTAFFVTNDHGRHSDDVADGFVSHGDNCEACRHLNLYAYGPDFKQNVIVDTNRELIDISATVAEILQFNDVYSNGKIMTELFK